MEWLDKLNQSIRYIEDHLPSEIDYATAARIACCSTFHYQRMFSYLAGVSLAEYIRRRRMTLAALELQSSDAKVMDLALKYGYDSPTSFSRAFQNVHGVSPSQAKKTGEDLKAHLRMTFQISIKGDVEMNYKIERRKAFRIVGPKRHYRMDPEENARDIPLFWQDLFETGRFAKVCSLSNRQPPAVLGVSTCMDGESFDYYVAAQTDEKVPEAMEEFVVPESTWAIFRCIGPMPAAIQALQKRIITEWLPTSGYEYADAPDIEVYPAGDVQDPDYESEVWLPIRKSS